MSDIAQDLGGVVLLPCPFCGGRGEVGGIPWVECQACEASGPQAETEEAAIAAWNTRAHSAEIAGALRDAERYRWLKDKANYARSGGAGGVAGAGSKPIRARQVQRRG